MLKYLNATSSILSTGQHRALRITILMGLTPLIFLVFIMYVFGGHFIFGTENFFRFWIVLRGKTSSQDNDEEQNEILLILSPRQYSKRGQNRIKQKLHSILQKPSYSL